MESKMWVVIYCVKDDSHVLVVDTEVIYDEELQVGDKVKFAYPGFKHHLDGEVKGFSGNYRRFIATAAMPKAVPCCRFARCPGYS